MISSCNIRTADVNDFNFILHSFEKIYLGFNTHTLIEKINIILIENNSLTYIANDDNNRNLGLIICQKIDLFNFEKNILIISEFFIEQSFRKKKIANILYEYVEQEAKKNNCSQIMVMCNHTATTTQNFFTKYKFKYTKKTYNKLLL